MDRVSRVNEAVTARILEEADGSAIQGVGGLLLGCDVAEDEPGRLRIHGLANKIHTHIRGLGANPSSYLLLDHNQRRQNRIVVLPRIKEH